MDIEQVIDMLEVSPDALSRLTPEEALELDALLDSILESHYNIKELYRDDPVGFIEDVLGETLYSDLKAICESVLDNQVTIVKSCNGIGKSFIAARLALWFFCCRSRPAVYLAAAPPLRNLESILWGELIMAADKAHVQTSCNNQKRRRAYHGVDYPSIRIRCDQRGFIFWKTCSKSDVYL